MILKNTSHYEEWYPDLPVYDKVCSVEFQVDMEAKTLGNQNKELCNMIILFIFYIFIIIFKSSIFLYVVKTFERKPCCRLRSRIIGN